MQPSDRTTHGTHHPALKSVAELFVSPTPICIDLDKIRRLHDPVDIDTTSLRDWEAWSYLSGQVVGGEVPRL